MGQYRSCRQSQTRNQQRKEHFIAIWSLKCGINGQRDRFCDSGNISGYHDGCAKLTQCPCKGQNSTCRQSGQDQRYI